MLGRFFYRHFRRVSRAQWALGRRLTPAGRLVAGALVAAMVFGPNTRLTVGYQAFTLLFVLLTIGAVCTLVPPPRLQVRRRLPRYATAGEPVSYQVVVRNPGRFRCRGVSLREDLEVLSADSMTAFDDWADPVELRTAIADLRTEVRELSGKLDSGQGTLGRVLRDQELYIQIRVLRQGLRDLMTAIGEDPIGSVNIELF